MPTYNSAAAAINEAGIEGTAAMSILDIYVVAKPLCNKGWLPYNDMQTILGENSGAYGRHTFHLITTASTSINIDDVLDDTDGGLNLLNMDVDPSVPDMSTDLMMSLSIRASATTTGSQSSKHLCTNTLLNSLEILSLHSSGTSIFTHPTTPQSSTLLLSMTLVSSTQVFKKAQVSAHGSTHIEMSSAARVVVKITPAAVIMNMQGSINCLTDTIEKSLVHLLEVVPPAPPAPSTMISHGLTIMYYLLR
ncbi:hypothetical protein BDR06DRAFT_973455 [Suillus hirtellus]|nr:hypothetical protein BDR06DRAFT_973455 [Suillus hirtellus]